MAASADNRWQRIEALFYAALGQPLASRTDFLDRECGDDFALKQEVRSLLDAADKSAGFLRRPIEAAALKLHSVEEVTTGRQIGGYRLLRSLGEGGMGRVYLAERADKLYQHQVAIKLMHPGFAQTQRMLLRFGAERQILANLNHPNIARLLDGGVDDGIPYLVMEYVDGLAVDEYCRQNKLTIEQRLRLFVTVCGAVEHAHKNLIVHRDIKPSNILVTTDGVPKLLDFGIAKLLAPDGADAARTRTTERMMTPEYASPEQVLGDTITTSTDVYALGILLYELLSGKRPFHLQTASPVEVVRIICEQVPTAPSVVGRSNPGSAPPDALRKLNADLDNIALMALRKEPARRYVSVGQLSEDVDAFLGGYPVRARTDAWSYRAGKFVHRHRAGFVAAVTVTIALIGFSIGMALLARRAEHERQAAEREAQFLNSIFQATTPEQARGRQVTGRELLDQGAKRVENEFAGEPQLQATLYDNIGRAYSSLGLYQNAETLLQRAYDLRRQTLGDSNIDTAATLDSLATAIRLESHYKLAEPLFRKALAIRQEILKSTDELVGISMSNLGECLYWEDQNQEAESLLRQSLAIERAHGLSRDVSATDNYLALALERKGHFQEATQLLREALEINARVDGRDAPDYANSLHNLAGALISAGDLTNAEAMDREALALRRKLTGPGHPDLGYPLNNLGYIFVERGDWAGAEPFLKENLEVRRLGGKTLSTGSALNNWARMLQEKGDYARAAESFQEAVDIMREVGGPESTVLAKVLSNLALLRADQHDYLEAASLARQSVAMGDKLSGGESPDLAQELMNLALVQSLQNDPAEAETLLRRALDIRNKELTTPHPAIISTEVRLGEVLVDEGKTADAEALLRKAVTELHAVPFPLTAWQFGEADLALGCALAHEGRATDAAKLLRDPESQLIGYPQASLRRQILERVRLAHR